MFSSPVSQLLNLHGFSHLVLTTSHVHVLVCILVSLDLSSLVSHFPLINLQDLGLCVLPIITEHTLGMSSRLGCYYEISVYLSVCLPVCVSVCVSVCWGGGWGWCVCLSVLTYAPYLSNQLLIIHSAKFLWGQRIFSNSRGGKSLQEVSDAP